MLHLLYLIAFTTIAFLAIANLIRSLLSVSLDSQRFYPPAGKSQASWDPQQMNSSPSPENSTPHPEMLDERGNPVNEPLLVMRSLTVEDAREKLDALYNWSPSNSAETQEES
ncbi:MAG: DUF2973 domain-containing protein [Symploca sp. SIO3C6]|uniref:DUF2973 domain-containing protein n=1 Tax=Symploca sp. SIO1C4 TaxID=2607765 RepID=A0A6B3N6G7_9CYAN|nr:DUF2973 domain-containing protein [Symploca sp. SIO3C6]NER28709.1 DUF2973 domain-containing protein [Symploca sp. SIO1C4]NET06975.1 DUF2973 domain-containing protein [Symploca sp. SIO2B6]NET49818.1 DUF2973 domain-containing protein [Merismopedia sp. SIO2A8]